MTRLHTESLLKRYGGIIATDRVSLCVESNSLHALIGPNGAGKTTLIAQLSGLLAPDSGQIYLDGENISRLGAPARAKQGLTRTFQITSVFSEMSALDNVSFAVQASMGHSFRFWRDCRRQTHLRDPAYAFLLQTGLDKRADIRADALSHGERRQLEIAMALATRPRVLLLDEPMAGMGAEESQLMTDLLQRLKGSLTILLVEHDMDVVFSLADTLSVLVYGKLIATGEPAAIRQDAQVQEAYLGDTA